MESKSVWTSKTMWVNLLALVGIFAQNFTNSFVISAEDQVVILGAINLILRIITKKSVVWGRL